MFYIIYTQVLPNNMNFSIQYLLIFYIIHLWLFHVMFKYYLITVFNELIISNKRIEKEKAVREKNVKACVTLHEKGECESSDGGWAMNLTGSGSGWIFSEHSNYPPLDFWSATDCLAIPQTNGCFDQIRFNFFLLANF